MLYTLFISKVSSGICWHKGWLAVPDEELSSEVEESLSGVVFSKDKSPGSKV